eukprot:CAMPEP_0114592140 /NCGR_PEP_ID=MMETSP0125-20121206/14047_1 /TAXON_ID=485358 ORGANISM="Aristerostoma sp., Strain ATCC 50986" /NCGR_SAMPLE_ID=MMETSP0125 /ASSEMBLY_ACC=CAM_ASM_000245 /LENGTH=77 /DNA_ID=CAMNT_0001790647 /DNA_START=220 /DNA_END=453 /DNA_ORIENTATION=-
MTQFAEGYQAINEAKKQVKKIVNAFFKIMEQKFKEKSEELRQDYLYKLTELEEQLKTGIEAYKGIQDGLGDENPPKR